MIFQIVILPSDRYGAACAGTASWERRVRQDPGVPPARGRSPRKKMRAGRPRSQEVGARPHTGGAFPATSGPPFLDRRPPAHGGRRCGRDTSVPRTPTSVSGAVPRTPCPRAFARGVLGENPATHMPPGGPRRRPDLMPRRTRRRPHTRLPRRPMRARVRPPGAAAPPTPDAPGPGAPRCRARRAGPSPPRRCGRRSGRCWPRAPRPPVRGGSRRPGGRGRRPLPRR